MSDLTLPGGLTSRILTLDDARAVYEVAAAQEQRDIGKVEIEPADIVSDWSRPSWDVSTHTIGVFDGDRMVAYGEITGRDRGDAAVHPDYRRRGIGTAIAGWLQQTARELGGTGYGSPVPEGSAGDRLLAKLGYRIRHTSWALPSRRARRSNAASFPRAMPSGRRGRSSIRRSRPSSRMRSSSGRCGIASPTRTSTPP